MNISPAFQFYPNDWLSSARIAMMDSAQEGAYIRLLAYDWTNDGIPADHGTARRLSRLPENVSIEPVMECFTAHPRKKGFLTNKRLQEERKKQIDHRKERSDSGLKGAKKRWLSHSSASEQLMAKNGFSSSSSSSSSSSDFIPPEKSGGEALPADMIACRRTLNNMYGREEDQQWSHFEESQLIRLAQRPGFERELVKIGLAKRKGGHAISMSITSLLQDWEKNLDHANGEPIRAAGKPAGKSEFAKNVARICAEAEKPFTP